jgi:NitT/TauT family transport system substrate-binding protein
MLHNSSPRPSSLSRRLFLKSSLCAAGTSAFARASTLAAPALAQARDEVTLQFNWLKSIQHGGYFAAIEKGFYLEQGLDTTVLPGGPGVDSMTLVANGRAMVGERDSTNLILARAKGLPLKSFAAPYQSSPASLISLKSKPVRTIQDMAGKTIAIPTTRRGSLVALVKRANVDPASITFVPTAGDPSILATGQVDGYVGWSTNEGLMIQMRGVEVEMVKLEALGDATYPAALYTTDDILRSKREILTRWLRATIKGFIYFASNPEEIAKAVVERHGQKGLDLALQTAESKLYKPFIMGGDAPTKGVLWIDRPFFEAGVKLAREAGVLTVDVPIDDLIDQGLLRNIHTKT